MPSLRVGLDEWSPWPLTRPKLLAHTDEIIMARARLDVIIRDMIDLQQKYVTTAMDERYLDVVPVMHKHYQDWMISLRQGLQLSENSSASQQHILL